MAAYESIYCYSGYDYPIEQLVKSIYIMQDADGCESIVDQMKEKLVTFFENIPEKKGMKAACGYHYYSTGLLVSSRSSNFKLVLEPWEVNSKLEQKILTYKSLKDYNRLWYCQLKEFVERKYSLNGYDNESMVEIKKYVDIRDKYLALTEEEKQHIKIKKIENSLIDKIRTLNNVMNEGYCKQPYHVRDYYSCYLNESELKYIEDAYKRYGDNSSKMNDIFIQIKQDKIINNKDCVHFECYGYSMDFEQCLEFYDQVKKIDNANLKTVLTKLGAI